MGLSLNHAMGYGLPVVTFDAASRHGPEFEALRHGVNGMLASYGDVGQLGMQASRLLLDDDLAARLGRTAKETMDSRYRLDHMVEGFLGGVRRAGVLAGARSAARQRLDADGQC